MESLTCEHVGLRVCPLILDDLAVLGLANNLAGQLRGVGDALAQCSPMRGIRLHNCTNAKFLPLVDQLLHEFFIRGVIRPDLVVLIPRVLCRRVDALVLNPQNLVVIVRGRGGVARRRRRTRGGRVLLANGPRVVLTHQFVEFFVILQPEDILHQVRHIAVFINNKDNFRRGSWPVAGKDIVGGGI